MKAVILAAGNGTRLSPLNQITNKCLLPLYDRPTIHYSILSLVNSGIKDILLVVGGNFAGEFVRILGDARDLGVDNFYYAYQKEAKGIAHALLLAENFAANGPLAVYLADNIFQNAYLDAVTDFKSNPYGARIFLKEVQNPQHFGVVETANGEIISIEEKPQNPKSNLVATGLYFYDNSVWEIIRSLQPSARGEYEITDVNKEYLRRNKLKYHQIEGDWFDSGSSIPEYLNAANLVSKFNHK